MRDIRIEPTFESWRDAARGLLTAGIPPEEILWSDDPVQAAPENTYLEKLRELNASDGNPS